MTARSDCRGALDQTPRQITTPSRGASLNLGVLSIGAAQRRAKAQEVEAEMDMACERAAMGSELRDVSRDAWTRQAWERYVAEAVNQSRAHGPRHAGTPEFNNIYKVVPWSATGPAVTGGKDLAVADPRARDAMFHNAFRTVLWSAASQAITGQHAPSNGAMCVADPRPGLDRAKGDDWFGGGHFGVLPWQASSGAVSAAAGYDNGHWSVADPRLPEQSDRLVAIIRALDGTWHRPFATLELASLQSLVDPEEHLELEGLSDAGWRERIGNAVPPDAAQAIAETMGRTLLMAWSGTGFMLSNLSIWVQPMAVALSVKQPAEMPGEGGSAL